MNDSLCHSLSVDSGLFDVRNATLRQLCLHLISEHERCPTFCWCTYILPCWSNSKLSSIYEVLSSISTVTTAIANICLLFI